MELFIHECQNWGFCGSCETKLSFLFSMKKDKNSKILRNKVSARAIRRLSGGRGVKGGGDINLCLLGREDCTTQLPILPAPFTKGKVAPVKT